MPTEQPIYNKDEAERVRDLGVAALHKGDVKKALWFFNKSKNLYHLDGIDDWIGKATKQPSNTGGDEEIPTPSQPIKKAPPIETPAAYTDEQLAAVNRIIGFVDYYDKLSLSYTVTEVEEIRKQYRQLSKQVHPDKNKAPRAQQAFQELTQAADTLSDPIARHKYNLTRLTRPTSFTSYSTHTNPTPTSRTNATRPSPQKKPTNSHQQQQQQQQQPKSSPQPIHYWEANTFKPTSANATPTPTKCPSCFTNCQMHVGVNSSFVKEELIAVCYSCQIPFSQVICPYCQSKYVIIYNPLHAGQEVTCSTKCRKSFKLRFPKPTPGQCAYSDKKYADYVKYQKQQEQQKEKERAENIRRMQEEILREQRLASERLREQQKREEEERLRKEERKKEQEQKKREQLLEQQRQEQEREKEERRRRTERINKIHEETLKHQEETRRIKEEREREQQRQQELQKRVAAEKQRQEEEKQKRQLAQEKAKADEQRKRKEREEREEQLEQEEHAKRMRKLHELRREFEQYREQEIKEETEERQRQEEEEARREQEQLREQERQAQLLARRDQLLKERMQERIREQERLKEQQNPPQSSPPPKSSTNYGKRKDFSSSPIPPQPTHVKTEPAFTTNSEPTEENAEEEKGASKTSPFTPKRTRAQEPEPSQDDDDNQDDDFETIYPTAKRVKKSPKAAAERKKQKQRTDDTPTTPKKETRSGTTTPESKKAKTESSAKAKTESSAKKSSPAKRGRKDLPVQKNNIFRYVVKGVK